MSMKIKNFLQMAANPKYTDNIIAKTVYDHYIENVGIKNACLAPYPRGV